MSDFVRFTLVEEFDDSSSSIVVLLAIKKIVTHLASYALPVITKETCTDPDARLQSNSDKKPLKTTLRTTFGFGDKLFRGYKDLF